LAAFVGVFAKWLHGWWNYQVSWFSTQDSFTITNYCTFMQPNCSLCSSWN